ncbi:hypothetical protein [Nocardioides panacis]|uniref:hypothetical protein n=1 Tax=Nocardioides panacis TaxID=2849501 RepID=UPI00345EC22B
MRASTSAWAPSCTATSMNRSFASPKSRSAAYASSGSARCRCRTPALAWNRRSSRSSRPPPLAITSTKASVICSCG